MTTVIVIEKCAFELTVHSFQNVLIADIWKNFQKSKFKAVMPDEIMLMCARKTGERRTVENAERGTR